MPEAAVQDPFPETEMPEAAVQVNNSNPDAPTQLVALEMKVPQFSIVLFQL